MENKTDIENKEYDFIEELRDHIVYKDFFYGAEILGYEVLKLLEIHITEKRLSAIVTAKELETGDEKTIIIYGIQRELKMEHMLEILGDRGSNIDDRIFVAYECDSLLGP